MSRARSRPRPWVAVAAGVALAAALAGCGIQADDEPRAIAPDRLPAESETTTTTAGGETPLATLYYTSNRDGREVLVPTERAVPVGGSSSGPTPATVLDALLAAPPTDDPITKIPAGTALGVPPELRGDVLTIDFNSAVQNVSSDGARLAFGQIVCTAVELADVDSVLITVEGRAIRPQTGDGETTRAALTCEDYANLFPEDDGQ